MNQLIEIQWLYYVALALALTCIVFLLLQRRFFNAESKKYGSLKKALEKMEEESIAANGKLTELRNDVFNTQSELSSNVERLKDVLSKEERAIEFESRIADAEKKHSVLQKTIQEISSKVDGREAELYNLKANVDLYSRILDFVDVGLYEEPVYLFETSERFRSEIKRVREKQKALIKKNEAIELPPYIVVEGSSKKGTAILSGQSKMMLRAFNIECDLLMAKVSPSNFENTLDRIQKNAESLEKLALSLMVGLTPEYVELKFEECKLQYQHKLKRTDEDAEQKMLREQMREEQKAIKEYQRAIAEAEKEERMYQELLSKARNELAAAGADEKQDLEDRISILELQLKEAESKEERAKSLAEQTRRGYVYIISNIGSFGENVYKIGLTRRLNPEDRVKELGDASVPFRFDIHALIFNDDAPALENQLHKRFGAFRVNVVNTRKEFFAISLEDIRKAVIDIVGSDVDFQMTAKADEYYESLRLQGRDSNVA